MMVDPDALEKIMDGLDRATAMLKASVEAGTASEADNEEFCRIMAEACEAAERIGVKH